MIGLKRMQEVPSSKPVSGPPNSAKPGDVKIMRQRCEKCTRDRDGRSQVI